MRYTYEEIEKLEEEIKENVEWLSTIDDDDIECIGIENLQSILSRFLGTTVSLTQ